MKKSNKILLIGNSEKAFGVPTRNLNGVTVCESILGGIEQTRKNQFQEIYVVLSSISGQIQQAMQTLRQSNPQARLTLLAQMLEEPLAMGLVRNAGVGRPLADDYQICPILPEMILKEADRQTVEPLTSEKELEYQSRIRELEILATQDDLTGLKNRRYLNQFLAQILALARQYHFQVTLLLFDIDNFKQYNDQFGHAVGDDVLVQAGKMIRHCCRGQDVVARMGGDEFAVVFWDLPEKQRSAGESVKTVERRKAEGKHPRETLFMAERFCREIAAARFPLLGPQGQGKLTISGGLASFPDDGKTAEELTARADEAMLEAKRQGKNQIVIIGEKNNHHPGQPPSEVASAAVTAVRKNGEQKIAAGNEKKNKGKKTLPSSPRSKPPAAANRKKKL
jgi:two-component system cell cycle response regulator